MTDSTTSTGELPDSLSRLYDDLDSVVEALRERAGCDEFAADTAELFSVLSNPQRVRLLLALQDGECCVCELQTALDSPQSTVATHLRKLTDAGLVDVRKEGQWSYYGVADRDIYELLDGAHGLSQTAEATE